ncbi:MAG: replication initiation protein [Verrucomicrobia bacterium]|nr:replication initiation protein [Verrucomicrobiota bacterium]
MKTPPDPDLSVSTVEEQGILESFFKLPQAEREIIRQLLERSSPEQPGVISLRVPFSAKQVKERRKFLLPIYRLIRYHRLVFDSIADGALRSTYLPWIESITLVRAGKEEKLELRLNNKYEKVWRNLKQRLDEPGVRLKSQYSSRLYQWARQYMAVGYKRVSLATLRQVLGLKDIRDNSGKLVQEAPLEAWANLKQRALDHALKEINEHSDVELELEFTGRGSYRKVQSLGFRIAAKKPAKRKDAA